MKIRQQERQILIEREKGRDMEVKKMQRKRKRSRSC
jgi:hypothetical protein